MSRHFKKILRKIHRFCFNIPKKIICRIRSFYYTSKIDEGGGKITITKPFIKFRFHKHDTSILSIKDNLRIIPHFGGNSPVVINMDAHSKLQIDGDFIIGQGVRIVLAQNSMLTIGGKEKESESGITSDTLIMVYKKIEIGKDFICAWNVFISDSDWHRIHGQNHQGNIIIGDHVWIANNNNILKGAIIGNNCVVASNSKIINKIFPNDVLIGGIPPKIMRENIKWSRDLHC